MRYTALAGLLVTAVLLAGCGDDAAEPPTAGPDATAPAGERARSADGATLSRTELNECVEAAGREIDSGRQVPGESGGRLGLEFDDTEYLGFVYWPESKTVADVYLADDAAAARATEDELQSYFAGAPDGDRLVQRQGNVVVQLDDEVPPADDEIAAVLDCAAER